VGKTDLNVTSPNVMFVVGGTPFVNAKFAKIVSGSPYFYEEWMKGNVFVNGGKEYSGLFLKLDLLNNEMHYLDPAGVEMVTTSELQKLVLFDTIAQQVFTFINSSFINSGNAPQKGWYLLLSTGTASLFKKLHKVVREEQPYNSATVEQHVETRSRYFVLYKNVFTEIKKIKDAPDILIDKKDPLLRYIKENNLKGKTDEEFLALIDFYNSL
jgi:hypothetical protein